MSSSRYCILLLAASVATPTAAYELGTHGRLSFEAYKRSIVKADPSLVRDLGIQDISNPFGTTYYDVAGDEVRSRAKHDFEQSAGRMPEEVDPLSISGWLLRGAIREDDLGTILGVDVGDNPHDDPYGDFFRVFKHFFDPVHDRALTTCFVEPGIGDRKAPDWAIGAKDAFAEPMEAEVGRRNHFTVFDAHEAMYRALTGKNADNQIKAPSATERKTYWATTFRSLGDVVHLIQDMAAAQHTRNDPHAGKGPCTGHKSVFENYIEARATQSQDTKERTQALDPTIITFPILNYGNYPVPKFIKYADIFSTARRDGIEGGFGLADYSNRGFFSAGTNLGNNDYPLPSNDRNQFAEEIISIDADTKTTYLLDGVFDTLNPALRALDIRKTKESIWYEPLLEFADAGVAETVGYVLDQRIYDAQADLLIPRAVAYSAGLIDYFFRGRLEAVDPTFTDDGVSLKVKNAIDAEKIPEWANENLHAQKGGGQFVVTVKYKQGEEEKLMTSNPVNLTIQEYIAPGDTADEVLSFKLPPLPDDATDVEYRLVFRGRLGQEDDAIAVGIVEPVSGFVVSPNYVVTTDPRISGPRIIERRSGKWQLTSDRNPQTGNVDWKGWYVNGRATKVLTWWGPTARYFPDPDSSFLPFRHDIYQNGEAFALAPYRVLGAGIARDSSGREWLVAICWEGSADIVFRRPNKKSTSAVLYDPVTNPDGWQELGRFRSKEEGFAEANVPWFFNGDGVEAQTVRLHVSTGQRHRLKMSLVDTVATVTDENNLPGIVRSSVQRRTCQQEYSEDSSCDEAGDRCLGLQTIQALNGTNYSSVQGAAGEFVIAVDYRDKEEVLGIYTVTEEHEHTVVRLSTNESRSICSRFGACSSPENYSFSKSTSHAEMKTVRKTVLHVPGFTDIVLASEHGTRQLDLVDSSEFVGQKLVNAVSEKMGSGDVKKEFRQTQYMDLRSGVYVGYEKLTEEAGPGRVFFNTLGGNTSVAIDTTEQSRQSITFRGMEIPVNTNPVSVRPRSTVMISNPEIENIPCEQTRESTSEPSSSLMYTPPILKTSGAWAVDSAEHLFVSMPVLGDNPTTWTGQLFNYLTEGDLQAIIPGAPAKPGYYPGGVIK